MVFLFIITMWESKRSERRAIARISRQDVDDSERRRLVGRNQDDFDQRGFPPGALLNGLRTNILSPFFLCTIKIT